MPLSPTTKLGSYEVSGLLGKGGMGEVYRARDAKLGREVAIKTLPPNSANSVSPGPGLAVSRDRARWAFSTGRQIYLRNLGEAEARPVQGAAAQAVFSPAFSPDGEWLAYVEFTDIGAAAPTSGSIRKIPISGGGPQTIAKLTGVTSNATATNVYVQLPCAGTRDGGSRAATAGESRRR